MMTPERLRGRRLERMQERRTAVRRQWDREEQQRRKKLMEYLIIASITVGLIILYWVIKS